MKQILQLKFFEAQDNSTLIENDLRLNLKRVLESAHLTQEEKVLLLISLSRQFELQDFFEAAMKEAKDMGLEAHVIKEAQESVALMGMLNSYYKFRTFVSSAHPEAGEVYKTAGLRMTTLARPAMGKIPFENIALALSIANGCPSCVAAHEKTLREHGQSPDKLHDVARLTAVLKGISGLKS